MLLAFGEASVQAWSLWSCTEQFCRLEMQLQGRGHLPEGPGYSATHPVLSLG